jgi:tRNA threonylcarbamoyladenosine biosynthesis protein TsaE
MYSFIVDADDESATMALGGALAELLPGGAVVALCGTLGAGKTRLVQAVAEANGAAPRSAISPTFVLVNEYGGRRPIYHFDAYRIKDDDEFLELGAEEYFAGTGLCFVEWADRVARCLPPERLEIRIEVTGETARRFEVCSLGGRYDEAARRLESRLAASGCAVRR